MFGSLFGRSRDVSKEARERVASGATLLDVRTREEFSSGHLPGAINIPVQELGARVSELPKGRDVVVYCRSGARSATACAILGARGLETLDLGSMSAW
jgi:phage shock protein E